MTPDLETTSWTLSVRSTKSISPFVERLKLLLTTLKLDIVTSIVYFVIMLQKRFRQSSLNILLTAIIDMVNQISEEELLKVSASLTCIFVQAT